MEISNAQHQGMSRQQQMEEVLSGCSSQSGSQSQQQERRGVRPQPEHALRCPRCDSTNTKFCYYNNYSLTQPRYFCKGCRRYWTQGGSLRNVPVGGGCRKNKRSSSSSKKPIQDQPTNPNPNPLLLPPMPPLLHYDPTDISLAFARLHNQPIAHHEMFLMGNPNPNPSPTGFLDILRGGFIDTTTTPTTTPNFYYGYGCNEGGGGNGVEEMTLPFEGGDNKPAMGLQWTIGGDGGDSGREYWNGSSWHGLINSSF